MRIKLSEELELSGIIHGQMRLLEWDLSDKELLSFIGQCLDLGVTSFDHADIYGDYGCEKKFGDALKLDSSLRDKIEIITKCGIKKLSNKFPQRSIGYYDYSYEHIIQSAELSLKNLSTDHIDVFLLHRPAPFFNPAEAAKAFDDLHKSGKVKHFGVSNFTPMQFESLQSHLDQKLVTNQVEISPYNLEHFDNGNIELACNYLEDRFNGIQTHYYEDAQIKKKGSYVDGILQDKLKTYYPKGQIECEFIEKNDKLYLLNNWDINGDLMIENGNQVL